MPNTKQITQKDGWNLSSLRPSFSGSKWRIGKRYCFYGSFLESLPSGANFHKVIQSGAKHVDLLYPLSHTVRHKFITKKCRSKNSTSTPKNTIQSVGNSVICQSSLHHCKGIIDFPPIPSGSSQSVWQNELRRYNSIILACLQYQSQEVAEIPIYTFGLSRIHYMQQNRQERKCYRTPTLF